MIRTAREVNDGKPLWVLNKIKMAVAEFLQANPERTAKDVTIACFGLAFKPDIDDLRESPAVSIAQNVKMSHPGTVLVVESNIAELPEKLAERLDLVSINSALERSEVIVLLVDHKEFKEFSPCDLGAYKVIDTRGVWNA